MPVTIPKKRWDRHRGLVIVNIPDGPSRDYFAGYCYAWRIFMQELCQLPVKVKDGLLKGVPTANVPEHTANLAGAITQELLQDLIERWEISENDSIDDIPRMEIGFPDDLEELWKAHARELKAKRGLQEVRDHESNG